MPVVTEPNSLLNDLYLKKQSILRIAKEIGSMASELREARAQMAMKEEILQQETGARKVIPQFLHHKVNAYCFIRTATSLIEKSLILFI